MPQQKLEHFNNLLLANWKSSVAHIDYATNRRKRPEQAPCTAADVGVVCVALPTMRLAPAATCTGQTVSTSGRSASLPGPRPLCRSTSRLANRRHNLAVQVFGVDSERFAFSQNNLDSDSPPAAPTAAEGQQYALQYAQLKREMRARTQRFSGFLGAYIFLTISGEAALCSLVGSAASYAYLVLIQQQVDSISPTDEVPIWEAEDNVEGLARPFAIGLAGYRAGLRPRLLIPIGLAAGIWACNQSGWHTLSRIEEGCLVLGFLSFKAALLLSLWDSQKPKFDPEASRRPKRPVQYNFDEEPNIDDVMDNIASVRKVGGRKF